MQYPEQKEEVPIDSATEQLLKQLISFAKEKGISLEKIKSMYNEEGEKAIPIAAFSSDLSPAEALCKYLKDYYKLSYAEIGLLLQRDDRSVWTSVNRAERKVSTLFTPQSDIKIPVSVFADRSHSILEHVIVYLQEHYDYTIYRIAKMLNKTPAALYAVAKRGKEKDED